MAATITEKAQEIVRDRVAEAARHAEHLAEDARVLKAHAAGAIEDAMYSARRAVTHGLREMEDIRDAAALKIRKAPLTTVGLTFAAGLLFGVALGWLGRRRRS
jgi:ElaB/YqjD/DUF883 family membrane-anchored ribosome-binding protein